MNLSDLPAINACLNSLSAVFLALGYWFIRRNNRIAHRNCMVAATITSAVFLVCYLVYHYFPGEPFSRIRPGSGQFIWESCSRTPCWQSRWCRWS